MLMVREQGFLLCYWSGSRGSHLAIGQGAAECRVYFVLGQGVVGAKLATPGQGCSWVDVLLVRA